MGQKERENVHTLQGTGHAAETNIYNSLLPLPIYSCLGLQRVLRWQGFYGGRYLPWRICITCGCTIARGWGNCLSSVNFYYCLWIPKRYPRKSSWVLDVVLPQSGTRSLWQWRPTTTARGLLFCLLISVRWEAQNDQMEIFSKSVDTSMFPGRVFCSLGIESPNPNQKCSEGKYSCVSRP